MAQTDFLFAALTAVDGVTLSSEDQALLDGFRVAATDVDAQASDVQAARAALEGMLQRHGLLDKAHALLSNREKFDELRSFNEMQMVVPGVYIGNYLPATNAAILKDKEITHICCCIDVQPRFPADFQYLILPLNDCDSQDVMSCFPKSNAFIEAALASGGKVFVHCGAGISRSAAITIAFVMQRMRMKMLPALALVKTARPHVCPNQGFRNQLLKYEKQLQLE
jgi:protein-tyrosine phosphatase